MENRPLVLVVVMTSVFIIYVNGQCTITCQSAECKNGGTCFVNINDCSKMCTCLSSFNGSKCEIADVTIQETTTSVLKVSSTATSTVSKTTNVVLQNSTELKTTLRPMSIRSCLFGMLTCEHGYCFGGMKCMCDPNWTGAKCEKLKCPLSCEGLCELIDNRIECKSTEPVSTAITLITSNPVKGRQLPLIQQRAVISRITETTTHSDIENRKCRDGSIACVHGYCKRETLSCVCDDNWKGSLCDELDCPAKCSEGCNISNNVVKCLEHASELSEQSPVTLETSTMVQSTAADIDEELPKSLKNRTCLPKFFVCVHGFCKKERLRFYCVCDSNWGGMFCDKLECPHCSNGCELEDGSIVCNTATELLVSFTAIPNPISTSTDFTSMPTAISTTTVGQINGSFPDGHVCSSNYTENQTKCMGIFPCRYGKCQNELIGSNLIKCVCDPGADGDMCEKTCCKFCSDHGRCRRGKNETEYCNCNFDYEGEFCENKIIPKVLEEETWYWWVVGVCLGLIVILVLALVVLPYWMWRNRVILIMKIVHYFQRYEDNGVYDFVNYYKSKEIVDYYFIIKSTCKTCDDRDESFVLKQLYSKLEVEMGFKLCLHFRDFIPGDTIANNIIRAVQGSRRTIMLLTPRYVQSEFTKFEYQMAQTEMLKRRHRIIPLVLDDISSVKGELDPNLEQIIHSVTYLEWPGEEESLKIQKFWKKLVLSMPKKKDVEEKRKAMSSSSSSPSSYNFSSQTSEIPLVSQSYSSDSSSSNRISIVSNGSSDVISSEQINSNGYLPSEHINSNGHIHSEQINSNGYLSSEQINSNGFLSSEQSNSNGYLSSEQSNNNGYLTSEPIKNGDIILKLQDDSIDLNQNGEKPSNLKSNINNYLDLIDPDSYNCSHS
ncbi:unnamed protein product [Mytilus edulis]|uniref:Uncharacterized protein n=1 Tax=Mytilus edulis TaxID=6550 RepID=A0A8S3PSB8_MYTED|nr:unnamed protein product [Mytilus edulis]